MTEEQTIFAVGFIVGALLVVAFAIWVMMQQERRHRDELAILRRSFDPELQNLPCPRSPGVLDGAIGNAVGMNTEWVKHTPYHWTFLLCGSRLQYWPTKNKWHWKGTVYDGGADGVPVYTVEEFMRDKTREFYE